MRTLPRRTRMLCHRCNSHCRTKGRRDYLLLRFFLLCVKRLLATSEAVVVPALRAAHVRQPGAGPKEICVKLASSRG